MSTTLARAQADAASGQPLSTEWVSVRRQRDTDLHLIEFRFLKSAASIMASVHGARWNDRRRRWEVPFIARVELRKAVERISAILQEDDERQHREYQERDRKMLADMEARRARNEAFYGRFSGVPDAS